MPCKRKLYPPPLSSRVMLYRLLCQDSSHYNTIDAKCISMLLPFVQHHIRDYPYRQSFSSAFNIVILQCK